MTIPKYQDYLAAEVLSEHRIVSCMIFALDLANDNRSVIEGLAERSRFIPMSLKSMAISTLTIRLANDAQDAIRVSPHQ